MPEKFTQEHRFLAIETPLGTDKLLLLSFTGQEGISQLFSFHLELLSEDININFDQIVGRNVTFSLKLADESPRYFNGFVSRFAQLPGESRFARYQAEVVPWFWFLTRTADCRIFQNMTVPDIIQKVFEDLKFKDFKIQLQANYRPWECCTQYRETACHFVMRLMEQEGIFFFFQHENGKHTLILADSPVAHKPCPFQSKVRYEYTTGPGMVSDEDLVSSWRLENELRPGRYALNDFNCLTPTTSLLATVQGRINQGGNQEYEVYDYPGEYETRDEAETYVKVRMGEEETVHAVVNGSSNCRSFAAGYRFDLAEHARKDQNGTYVLTTVSHNAYEGGTFPGMEFAGETVYSNAFSCIPHSVPFRPLRISPNPLMQGSQTAIVVGPAGEEIHVDKYGRVKVQFHWDREGKYDENSSCWIRVAQSIAGKGWGMIYTPRIGQEVIVDFLEGDPDQPIITGRVYNAESMPPYTLPDEKTKSTFKSYSSKGGGGFNEIRFEDKKGSEQVFLHGEKDLDIRIKNDRREWIGRDRNLVVKRDKKEVVERDKKSMVKRHQYQLVKQERHLTVDGDSKVKIGGSHSLSVSGDVNEKFSMNHAEEAGMAIHLKAGMTCVIEAGVQLTLKVGGNFIDINPGGVFIQGTMVMINSGGAAGSGAGARPAAPTKPEQKEVEIADNADPGSKEPTYKTQRAAFSPSQAAVFQAPWHDPNAKKNREKKSWIEIELVDADGNPVPGERFRVTLPDGKTVADGTTNEKGKARVEGIDPGTCQVTFPDLDESTWEPK